MIASLFLAFTDFTLSDLSPNWVGFSNFQRALSGKDDLFWSSLLRTLRYAIITVPLGIGGALLAAIALNQGLRLTTLFRTLFFLPSLTPVVASAVIWAWLYNADWGLLNYMLSLVGIQGPKWISDSDTAMMSLIIVALWGIIGGNVMIIFLAGLQGVPRELHEAAEIDGANTLQRFRAVTLPMISPTIFFNLVIGIIAALKVFAVAVVMTNGGPSYSTWFFILHLYNNAFQAYDMGYASALAWIFMAVVVTLTVVNLRFSNRWVYYEGDNRKDDR
ncbi:MAG: sugar ABC transporter permease [Chloroflexota bacterium]|nr:MAG: sugar ABC transporter permease [Chloroflexota bacterium]